MVSATFDPPPSRKIRGGQDIKIAVDATDEKTPGGSWQSGVQAVRVTGPDSWYREIDVPQQPCDPKKGFDHTWTYTVPPNPPPSFELCAQAKDYAKHRAKDSCATFYTALHYWKGTYEETEDIVTTGITHISRNLSVTFSLWSTSNGHLEGEADFKWSFGEDDVAGPCAGESISISPSPVKWHGRLTGQFTQRADGSVAMSNVKATPDSEAYTSIAHGVPRCPNSGQSTATTDRFLGFTSITVPKVGLDEPRPMTLGANEIGTRSKHLTITEQALQQCAVGQILSTVRFDWSV